MQGMLPPFAIETEESRAMARHCSMGIEPRISSERIILLDTQVKVLFMILLLFCLKYIFFVSIKKFKCKKTLKKKKNSKEKLKM